MAATHELDEGHRQALEQRFRSTGEHLPRLTEAVELATLRTAVHRQANERANLLPLQLNATQREMYTNFAGNPERAGEYLRWFGRMAVAGFSYPQTGLIYRGWCGCLRSRWRL
jgi:hypothetical protein